MAFDPAVRPPNGSVQWLHAKPWTLVECQFREDALVKSIVVWTIYKERIENSTVGK
jgi:hypothetical protein